MDERMMIRSLENGKTATLPLLVKQIEARTTRNGKPYSSITVSDGADELVCSFWDATADQITEKYLGKVANVTLEMGEYTTIRRLRICTDYNVRDFVQTVPISSETMFDDIMRELNAMRTPLRQVAIKLYQENARKLLYWSGAMKIHHAVYGGLLYHSYRMMKCAQQLCQVYTTADEDLLVIGTLLHDIGKLKELNVQETGAAVFTVAGNLEGHILMGTMMVHDAAMQINILAEKDAEKVKEGSFSENRLPYEKIPDEQIRLLEHMIASHHGQREYGAIILPATLEAMLLNQLDMIDSRAYIYENMQERLEPGTCSNPIGAMDGTRIYKPLTVCEAPAETPASDDSNGQLCKCYVERDGGRCMGTKEIDCVSCDGKKNKCIYNKSI